VCCARDLQVPLQYLARRILLLNVAPHSVQQRVFHDVLPFDGLTDSKTGQHMVNTLQSTRVMKHH
jgi:hypothetical protein